METMQLFENDRAPVSISDLDNTNSFAGSVSVIAHQLLLGALFSSRLFDTLLRLSSSILEKLWRPGASSRFR